jgi:hypothetical protein
MERMGLVGEDPEGGLVIAELGQHRHCGVGRQRAGGGGQPDLPRCPCFEFAGWVVSGLYECARRIDRLCIEVGRADGWIPQCSQRLFGGANTIRSYSQLPVTIESDVPLTASKLTGLRAMHYRGNV